MTSVFGADSGDGDVSPCRVTTSGSRPWLGASHATGARCSTSCSDPTGERLESGRNTCGGLKNRTGIDRFSDSWTRVLTVRDREAPGSNPGPPTSFGIQDGQVPLYSERA